MELRHSVVIAASPATVFDACRRVAEWPKFMPAVAAACVIDESAGADVVEICADVNGTLKQWRSRRTFSDRAGEISFHRLDPQPPLVALQGAWKIVRRADATCELELLHRFEAENAQGARAIEDAIRRNARTDLAALRVYCESRDA